MPILKIGTSHIIKSMARQIFFGLSHPSINQIQFFLNLEGLRLGSTPFVFCGRTLFFRKLYVGMAPWIDSVLGISVMRIRTHE
jgi:hypothetical protein